MQKFLFMQFQCKQLFPKTNHNVVYIFSPISKGFVKGTELIINKDNGISETTSHTGLEWHHQV